MKNRFQLHDPKSDRWAIFSFAGDLLRTKKSPGPEKGIRIGVPKSRRR